MLWIGAALGLYLLLLLIVVRFSLYPPRTPVFFSPGSVGASQEDIEFRTADGIDLRGWWVGPREPSAVAIVAHGYLMNRSELSPAAVWLAERGCASVVFDLRAHGKSGGRKCGFGVYESKDVEAAARYARARAPNAKIVLIGSSMGSAACAFAAASHPGLADALVIDSCYGRMPGAVLGWWRFLGGRALCVVLAPTVVLAWPFARVNPFKVDVAGSLARCEEIPVLLLHGSADNLALPKEAERNLAACRGESRLVWFDGCGHSEGRWLFPDQYREALLDFLETNAIVTKVLAREPA